MSDPDIVQLLRDAFGSEDVDLLLEVEILQVESGKIGRIEHIFLENNDLRNLTTNSDLIPWNNFIPV